MSQSTQAALAAVRTSPAKTRLLIADKNPLVRAGIADYINKDGRFELSGLVATGAAFLSACEHGGIDVGIIGWSLPDMSGGDVLSALRERRSKVRTIIYTGEDGTEVLRQAVRLGASGFISKGDDPAVLLDTVAAVSRGRLCLPYVDLNNLNKDPLESLTARERELLAALANGLTNLQIATRIGISNNTVKYHLKNLDDKLGVSNRAMAVALYLNETHQGR